MKWAGTVYGVHLLTSAAAFPELCRWEHWQKAFPIVDRLMTMSPATAAIRTGQTFDNESHWLGFGRMIWSRKNNEKWTQKYRSPQFADRQLNCGLRYFCVHFSLFLRLHIIRPNPNQCDSLSNVWPVRIAAVAGDIVISLSTIGKAFCQCSHRQSSGNAAAEVSR